MSYRMYVRMYDAEKKNKKVNVPNSAWHDRKQQGKRTQKGDLRVSRSIERGENSMKTGEAGRFIQLIGLKWYECTYFVLVH